MRKIRKAFIFIIVALLTGIISSFLVYSGLWETFSTGWKTVGFFGFLLIALLAFYITLTVHELTHLFAFKVQGVGIRALYLTVFVFHKTDKGWRLTVNPKLWILFGGLVVPDLPPIESDEDYKRLTQTFAKALIAAPIATITFAFLIIVGFIVSVLIPASPIVIGIMAHTAIIVTLLSTLYTFTFFLSNQTFYGDVVAYKKIKTDEAFTMAQISQYLMFSSADVTKTEDYLWSLIITYLRENKIKNTLFDALILSLYINGVIRQERISDETVDRLIKDRNIMYYLRRAQTLEIAYDIAFFHYVNKDVEKAIRFFEDIRMKVGKHVPEEQRIYLEKRAEHVLHLSDHSTYLSDHKNIHIGQFWIFESLLDPYEAQKETHQKLPYVEYSSPVAYLYEEQKQEEEKSDSL
ncbi:MAG: site-2 protease family protein [Acholeplasmataceae bacterium]|nr:site-2 protease family protein [Acholeplasmataceae bacterium]